MRADAQKNYDHLLDVAGHVIAEQGAEASLRDIARRAGVVVGTLYRHFPTREALLEALLRNGFDALTARADELAATTDPKTALVEWARECTAGTRTYQGVTTAMVAAMEDPESALHASCVALRTAGTRLLHAAQAHGVARTDLTGDDLFALIAGLAWIGGQDATAPRADHLFDVVISAVTATPALGSGL